MLRGRSEAMEGGGRQEAVRYWIRGAHAAEELPEWRCEVSRGPS